MDEWDAAQVRGRVKGLRHDLVQVRRMLMPTRDALQAMINDRAELTGEQAIPRTSNNASRTPNQKLLRAGDGLDVARELVAGLRDYHAAAIATKQNEAMNRLGRIASFLLVPTFIVGMFGQNFHLPAQYWGSAYWWSLVLIGLATVARSRSTSGEGGCDSGAVTKRPYLR